MVAGTLRAAAANITATNGAIGAAGIAAADGSRELFAMNVKEETVERSRRVGEFKVGRETAKKNLGRGEQLAKA